MKQKPFVVGIWLLALMLTLGGNPARTQDIGIGDPGRPVYTEPSPQLPAAIGGRSAEPAAAALRPFGYNLFTGGFSKEQELGLNPDYRISAGDKIALRIWGAVTIDELLTVDPQGNIFVPNVGPVHMEGVRNADLHDVVVNAVRSVYKSNVNVYVSLSTAQPVAVFVTGYVRNPGRYAGIASNSILYFIDQGRGIDPESGSYRNIQVIRGGKVIGRADLYAFLLKGEIQVLQFKDNDTIVVGRRGSVVSVSGGVLNSYAFELAKEEITGTLLSRFARPRPSASHVQISGTRNQMPFSTYLPLSDFSSMILRDGDTVVFEADRKQPMILVRVEGEYEGTSQFAVPRDTTLGEMLDHIPVDPKLADYESVSLRRVSVAERQKQTLEESLRRLESTYLLASSATDEEARIRSQEAALIADFVKQARRIAPKGRVVIAHNPNARAMFLEHGDTITIPKKTATVLISGEVLVSQAVIYTEGDSVHDYIERSGGFTEQANPDRIVVVHPSGIVETEEDPQVRPGDEILVLPEVPTKNLQLAATIVDIIFKVAVTSAIVLRFGAF